MVRTSWTFMRIAGIPIRAHWTLLLFLPILAWVIAGAVPILAGIPLVNADADAVTAAFGGYGAWAAGAVVAVGLFLTVLLHELGHALTARAKGYEIDSITLWIFGGLAGLKKWPKKPGIEVLVSINGPIVSFVLGGIGLGAGALIAEPWTRFTVAYLGYINVVIGVFNLLPAFPLDGGRILRAILATRMPYVEATRKAAATGKVLAVLLGFLGVFVNLFLVFIAFFIYMAANQEAQSVAVNTALEPIKIREVMVRDPPTVTRDTPVEDLVERMLAEHQTGFPVVEGERVVGVVTLTDVRDVPREERAMARVGDLMTADIVAIGPDDTTKAALEAMNEHNIGRLVVMGGHDGEAHLEGLVTREGVIQAFEIAKAMPPRQPE